MRRNTSNQKWRVFEFNLLTGNPVIGDAANITAKISKDFGPRVALTDVHPTEAEDGYYYFDLTAAETDADVLEIFPESSTPNVVVFGNPVMFNTLGPPSVSGVLSAGYSRSPNTAAGSVSGWGILVDRLNYGSTTKIYPVDEAVVRTHCQVSNAFDDGLLFGAGGYVMAATGETEDRASVALIRQKRRHYPGGDFNGSELELVGPVSSITQVGYLDGAGVAQVLSPSLYRLVPSNGIYFNALPSIAPGPGALWVDYETGYGDTFAAVPAQWQNIVLQITMRRYETREGADGVTDDAWEKVIDRLIVIAGGNRRY